MNRIQVSAIFCEDVREEQHGLYTLAGVLTDRISIAKFPAMMSKLGFHLRIQVPVDKPITAVEANLIDMEGTIFSLSDISPDLIASSRTSAKAIGLTYFTLITRGTAAPFGLPRAGTIKIEVKVDRELFEAGRLHVSETPPEA